MGDLREKIAERAAEIKHRKSALQGVWPHAEEEDLEIADAALKIMANWLESELTKYEASYQRTHTRGLDTERLRWGGARDDNERLEYGRAQGIELSRRHLLSALAQSLETKP